jgi:hypothetical protein
VRKALALAVALAVPLTLGGCSLVGSSSSTPKPTATRQSALAALVPVYPAHLTAAKAKSATVATADAIQALITSTEIIHVDDRSRAVAATASTGAFYGVERAVTTAKGLDVIEQAQAMEKLLVQAGWIERNTNTATASYTVAMSTYTNAGASVLLLEADETPGSPPAIVLEIESPDLPKK